MKLHPCLTFCREILQSAQGNTARIYNISTRGNRVTGFVHRTLENETLHTKHKGPAKSMKGTGLFFRRSKSLSSSGIIGLKMKFPKQILVLALSYQILYESVE